MHPKLETARHNIGRAGDGEELRAPQDEAVRFHTLLVARTIRRSEAFQALRDIARDGGLHEKYGRRSRPGVPALPDRLGTCGGAGKDAFGGPRVIAGAAAPLPPPRPPSPGRRMREQ
jgi:hypothetical protein